MMTVETLCVQFTALAPDDVHRWIGNAWVRPDQATDGYVFHDIDVQRVRLILELRDEMQVNEDAMPVVLSLLDQVYDLRRAMRRLVRTLDRAVPGDDQRQDLLRILAETHS
jgi:chaperone modulatory protein CbpM